MWFIPIFCWQTDQVVGMEMAVLSRAAQTMRQFVAATI